MSLIKIKDLGVTIGNKQILKNINLEIEEGSTTVFIGPSGSGKTTLLRTLNLLQQPTSGSITVADIEVDAPKIDQKIIKAVRTQSAMVFQQFNLFKNLTVEDNVASPLILNGILPKEQALAEARRILADLGLAKTAKQYPATLSGGQQQRVSIARAIAVKPKIILFDEPTSVLDPEMVGGVLTTIEALTKENITTVLVTHEMEFAKHIANQVVFLEDGEILETGSAKRLLIESKNERIDNFVNSLEKRYQ